MLKKAVSFILFGLISSSPLLAETHPFWDCTEYVDPRDPSTRTSSTSTLQSRLSTILGYSESQLRALITDNGKNDSSNINTTDDVHMLGVLYHLTSTSDYAWRAAVLLDEYAAHFPNWPKNYSHEKDVGGIWSNWHFYDLGYALRLALGYELIRDSGQLSAASTSNSELEDLLELIIQEQCNYRMYTHNQGDTQPIGMIIYGRVLDDAELVREGYWWLKKLIYEGFTSGGLWHEGTYGYHFDLFSGFATSTMRDVYSIYVDGYSDPDPFSYTPIDRLDTELSDFDYEAEFGTHLDRAQASYNAQTMSDGYYVITNECTRFSSAKGNPPSGSLLMNGMHAMLANGTGSSQTQLHMDFSPKISHAHYDPLNLIYYDKGEEVIGGTGYNEGSRSWNADTRNQNIVVVNGAQSKYVFWSDYTDPPYIPGGGGDGTADRQTLSSSTTRHNNLLLFEDGYSTFDSVKVMEVDGLDGYDDEATVYKRLLALVNIASSDMYAVDFFRVKGGTQYDWCIHGNPNSYTYSDNLSMGSDSGTFGSITFTNSATTANSWKATFDYSGSGTSLDFNVIGVSGTTIYKGTGPRSGTGTQGYYVARRTAATGDDVVYMATHEAYTSSPHISSIEKLEFDGDDGTAIGIKVTLDGGKIDYVIATTDSSPYTEHTVTGVSNFNIKGRFAHVRVTSGVVTWAYLVEGSKLTYGATVNLIGTYNYSGTISDVNRVADGDSDNSFIVSAAIPTGSTLTNKTLILTWGNDWTWGYKISSTINDKIIIDGEPAFYLDSGNVEMEYFPAPEHMNSSYYSGPVTYLVPGSAVYDQGQVLTTAINSACSMNGTGGSRFAGTGAAIME